MATAAEMRARRTPAPLPKDTHTVTVVEGQHLLAEAERLEKELQQLLIHEPGRTGENGEKTSGPRKAGQRANPRIDEVKAALAAIPERLAEFQNELGLTGMTPGEWQRFKDEHPADPRSAPDQELTDGACSASALFHAMGKFATSWNGDPISETDWNEWTGDGITYADRRDLVTVVASMHEDGMVLIPEILERIVRDPAFRRRLKTARDLGVSEKRLLDWEPIETHDHEYDENGRLVRTVVTRESEWDELERSKMLALAEFEAGICDCGLHRSLADQDPALQLELPVCPVCADLAKSLRIIHDRDKAELKTLGKNPPADAVRPDDGRQIRLVPKT